MLKPYEDSMKITVVDPNNAELSSKIADLIAFDLIGWPGIMGVSSYGSNTIDVRLKGNLKVRSVVAYLKACAKRDKVIINYKAIRTTTLDYGAF